MAILLKGRAARQQRRREIITQLGEIVDMIVDAHNAHNMTQPPNLFNELKSQHRMLTYELTELATIDDQQIRRKT